MTAAALLHLCLMSCVSMTPLKGKLRTSGSGAHGGARGRERGGGKLGYRAPFPLFGKLFKPIVKLGSFSLGG
ncbi:unnamed protein product [Sphagnum balticum]